MEYVKLQMGCLVILSYLAFVYIRESRLYKQKLRKTFFDELLVFGIISIIFDGLTAYVINQDALVNTLLNRILHLFFLIGLDSAIFFMCLYMIWITGAYPRRIIGKIILYVPYALNIIFVVADIGALEYREGSYTRYSMGPPAYTCFIMAAVYIIICFFTFFKRWHSIEAHKRAGVFTYLMVIGVVTTVQMCFPETLITSLALTVAILGIYLNLEDPAIKKLSHIHSDAVTSFADLIENRDDSTGGHIKRTSTYVEMIAAKLCENRVYASILTKDYTENLKKAAPMHDIGKISVPDSILQKPGKLTDEEFEIMKKHAENGEQIIRKTFRKLGNEEYRTMARLVAKHHHEKWNGRGYPDGLKEEEIPLCARIMAVADVFDAVSAKRCYRDAMPLEKCFAIIEEGRGTDFDPQIVDAFLSMKEEIIQVHAEFSQEE